MSKPMDLLEEKLMPVAAKISGNRYLLAIRDGFMLAMPLLIIGAMSLLVANFPIQGFLDFMASIFGANWKTFFTIPFDATMSIMTIFVVYGIANSLSLHYELEGISSGAIALVAFFILTPFATTFTPADSKVVYDITGVIPMEWLGSKGLFVGMFTAIFTTEIIRFVNVRGWVIKMPEGVPPTVSKAFSALIPAFMVIACFDIVRLLFTFTSYHTVHGFIYKILQAPLTSLGDSLGATLIANLFIGLFWVFGIHGANVVGSVMSPIWLSLSADNLTAFKAGGALPHVITQQFQEIYLQLGGSGSTLALCLTMVFLCKSEQCKKLGRLAILPGLFNINEPITFGLPIVLNPIMMIPFILTPMILAVVCYLAISTGLVPRPSGVIIPWTTPAVFGGFLIAGVRGALLQIVELAVAFLCYYPFIRTVDKQYFEEEKAYNSAENATV
ncbi:PTS cellobiose transporter subunit IIC [Clostridium folliculivorans]|uniref:Permease IIC component n=1 Tax=Clostridium folliculivorans TaxID=2886038 RepID=A0A9W5Y7J2_9CLOT|nr:PTS cellobiose transporter subunit IIC [Clostridium folliculivorans]GKU27657.1 permease IIC component [Clostridium folliculivorans]GKU32420.1 permease IIC component [Clostridium folliculivorans]